MSPESHRPDPAHAAWFLLELLRWGMLDRPVDVDRVAASVCRLDLYDAALGFAEAAATPAAPDRFRLFDGRSVDPRRPLEYLAGCGFHRLRVPMPELAAANAR